MKAEIDPVMPGDGDDDELMNHVALEAMHAIDAKDKEGFLSAIQVLMAHEMMKLMNDEGDKE